MWCPTCNKEVFLDRIAKFVEHVGGKGGKRGGRGTGSSSRRGCFAPNFHPLLEAVRMSSLPEGSSAPAAAAAGTVILSASDMSRSPFSALLPPPADGNGTEVRAAGFALR